MKHSDIVKLVEAGLISEEQKDRIIARFDLREGGRFMTILLFFGAILIAAGIVLLISANWDQIHRGIKIGTGLALMGAAHAAGCYFRNWREGYPKASEALHMLGSLVFLANIGLVGQIYHLSSRAPNAVLVWWLGIAGLPWVLRSKAQFILLLLGFGTWLGMELGDDTGLFHLPMGERLPVYMALLSAVYLSMGHLLRRTEWHDFAEAAERLGLLGLQAFLFPLTWGILDFNGLGPGAHEQFLLMILSSLALSTIFFGFRGESKWNVQWRATWKFALVGVVVFAAVVLICSWQPNRYLAGLQWAASLVLAVFCLIEIQAGLQSRSRFMVNAGVVFFALTILATYLSLIGSMAQTGLMFLISGVFLVVFAIYLEKKRRAMMAQLRAMG